MSILVKKICFHHQSHCTLPRDFKNEIWIRLPSNLEFSIRFPYHGIDEYLHRKERDAYIDSWPTLMAKLRQEGIGPPRTPRNTSNSSPTRAVNTVMEDNEDASTEGRAETAVEQQSQAPKKAASKRRMMQASFTSLGKRRRAARKATAPVQY